MAASRGNRITQAMLILVGFIAGLVIAFIVTKSMLSGVSVLTKEQRKLDEARAPVEYIRVPGIGLVAYQFLFEEISEPGESLDSFALRIAPRLRDYTASAGYEACGVIAANDAGQYGVVIGTSRGHTVCVNFHARVPVGMKATAQTIHSHTTMASYRANPTDRLVLGVSARLGQLVRGDSPDLFSEEDFMAPGYMIGANTLWHQEGKSAVRMVGALP